MKIRDLQCDHILEDGKEHPAYTYICIGNTTFALCLTCWNAVKGQVYEGETKRLLMSIEDKKRYEKYRR